MSSQLSPIDNFVSASSFGHGGYRNNIDKTKDGPVFIMKHNTVEAIMLSKEDYEKLYELQEDVVLLSSALARLSSPYASETVSHDEILARYNLSEADLEDFDSVELE